MDAERMIETRWQEFAAEVLDAATPEAEREELRAVFFAGISTALAMITWRMHRPAGIQPGDLVLVMRLEAELEAYVAETRSATA